MASLDEIWPECPNEGRCGRTWQPLYIEWNHSQGNNKVSYRLSVLGYQPVLTNNSLVMSENSRTASFLISHCLWVIIVTEWLNLWVRPSALRTPTEQIFCMCSRSVIKRKRKDFSPPLFLCLICLFHRNRTYRLWCARNPNFEKHGRVVSEYDLTQRSSYYKYSANLK